MQNNTAILLPNAFPFVNLQAFVNDLLISLSVARVTIVYENRSSETATTILACKESANNKWYTLNVDRPYKGTTYFFGSAEYRDRHLVILAFNASSWLYLIEIKWLLESYKWGWHGSSQYLFVIDNEIVQDQEILEELRNFRQDYMYTALLRYTRSGVVEIFKLPDNGQLQRLVYTNDTERSLAGSLHHYLFTTDQFVDLNGEPFCIHANLHVPYLFYAELGGSRDKYDENSVGGAYVHLAIMIGRYMNVTVSYNTLDYLAEFDDIHNKAFKKYTIEEILKVRIADEILPSSTNEL